MLNVKLRNENELDVDAIFDLTKIAFTRPGYTPTEHFIVNALREMGALPLSLVAEFDGKIIGHVAFSPATITDGSKNWYALGPISVLPVYQRQGVGTVLVNEGVAQLKVLGAAGCLLLGSPDYYGRFGFRSVSGLFAKDVSSKYLQILPFTEARPYGGVLFHAAFSVTA